MSLNFGRNTDDSLDQEARLAEFVADLKKLRRRANQPSLRTMARRSNYSHTALSGVLSGGRLPSQELTLAFVRACGGDEDEWRERWAEENAVLNADEDQPGDAGPDTRGVRPRAWILVGALVLLLVAAGVAALRWPDRNSPEPENPQQAAADGSDPQEQRCDVDAVHATTTNVGAPPFGTLTLRYSARCRAAWPLFVSNERVPPGSVIHLETRRPSDGAVTAFDYPFVVTEKVWSVFGNNLSTTAGCVVAAIEIRAPEDQRTLAATETACLTPG